VREAALLGGAPPVLPEGEVVVAVAPTRLLMHDLHVGGRRVGRGAAPEGATEICFFCHSTTVHPCPPVPMTSTIRAARVAATKTRAFPPRVLEKNYSCQPILSITKQPSYLLLPGLGSLRPASNGYSGYYQPTI
jgi:hypothetical protein